MPNIFGKYQCHEVLPKIVQSGHTGCRYIHFICFGSDYSTFGRRLLYSFAAAFIISHCFLFRRNSEKCFRKSDPDMKTIINNDTDADVVKLCTKSSNDIKYNDDEKYLYDKSPTLDSLLMLGCPLTSWFSIRVSTYSQQNLNWYNVWPDGKITFLYLVIYNHENLPTNITDLPNWVLNFAKCMITHKNSQTFCNILPKWQNFAKTGHTAAD